MNTATNTLFKETEDRIKVAFNNRKQQFSRSESRWLTEQRDTAFNSFLNQGLPTKKLESWKYTSIKRFIDPVSFQPANKEIKNDIPLESYRLVDGNDTLMVFINGVFTPDLSDQHKLNEIINYSAFSKIEFDKKNKAYPNLSKISDQASYPFAAINTSFFSDGLVIEIPEQKTIEKPIHIIHVSIPEASNIAIHPRLLILSGKNSQASIIEHFVSLNDDHPSFTNALTEISLAEHSQLNYFRANRQQSLAVHIGGVHVEQGEASEFNAFSFCASGQLVHNDIHIKLNHPNTLCHLNGIYLTDKKRHVDNYINIEHMAVKTTSNCLYKGIAKDQSRAIFSGRIHIHPDAQESDASLYNRNLLLSSSAEIDSKPELEIYADNVKAAHGTTITQLDEKQIYYFRSRGIAQKEAEAILNYAFIEEMINKISQSGINKTFNQWLQKIY